MPLEIYYQNPETGTVEPTKLSVTTRLNNLDTAELAFIPSEMIYTQNTLAKGFWYVDEVDGSSRKNLFTGFTGEARNSVNSDGAISWSIPLKGKLSLLQHQNTGVTDIINGNIIDILNDANLGIKFEGKNLENSNISIAYKSISYKTSNQSWWDFLVEFAKKLDFFFWYDYNLDRCYIGEPDTEILVTNDSFISSQNPCKFASISFKKDETLANRVVALGGGVTKLTIERATADVVSAGGYQILRNGANFFVEDKDSIQTYGLYEQQISSPDIVQLSTTKESIEASSNLLYAEAVSILKNRKDPQVLIQNFEYYSKSAVENPITNGSYFSMDFNENPNLGYSTSILGKFYISDVTHEFALDSSEGYYQCTLINKIANPISANIMKKYENSLVQKPPLNTSPIVTETFLASTDASGVLDSVTINKNFSFTAGIKRINRLYVLVSGKILSGQMTLLANISIDGVELSTLFNFSINTTSLSVFPASGKYDILELPELTQNQIYQLTDTSKSHLISFYNLRLFGVGSHPAVAEISYTIEAEAEI